MADCSVVRKRWSELTTSELYDFLKLRTDVFLVEQKVDEEELDFRDKEDESEHWFIHDEHGTAAYIRVIVDAEPSHLDARHSIGRVAVRPDRRGEGLAQILFGGAAEAFAHVPIVLHAQEYIVPLYAKYGFEPFGEMYMEAGLPHISMYRAAVAPTSTAPTAAQ